MLLRKIIRLLEDFDSFCRSVEPWDIELKPSTWRDMFALSCWLYSNIGTNWIDLKTRQLPGVQLMLGKLGMGCAWCAFDWKLVSFCRLTWRVICQQLQVEEPVDVSAREIFYGSPEKPSLEAQRIGVSRAPHDVSYNKQAHRKICHWTIRDHTLNYYIRDHINASAAFAFSFLKKITCDGPWTCFLPKVRLAITVGEPSQRLVDATYMPA